MILIKKFDLSVFFGHLSSVVLLWRHPTYMFFFSRNIFGNHSSVISTKYHKLSAFFGFSSVIIPWQRLKYMFFSTFSESYCDFNKYHKLFVFFRHHSSVISPWRRLTYMFFNILRHDIRVISKKVIHYLYFLGFIVVFFGHGDTCFFQIFQES